MLAFTSAQMEMRAIFAYLFRDFTFHLGEVEQKEWRNMKGINRGTMGPASFAKGPENPLGIDLRQVGLNLYAKPRN